MSLEGSAFDELVDREPDGLRGVREADKNAVRTYPLRSGCFYHTRTGKLVLQAAPASALERRRKPTMGWNRSL